MLFCSAMEVNDVWATIAHATAANELGIAAKVAPKPIDGDSRRDRLICVYTTDFKDKVEQREKLGQRHARKVLHATTAAVGRQRRE